MAARYNPEEPWALVRPESGRLRRSGGLGSRLGAERTNGSEACDGEGDTSPFPQRTDGATDRALEGANTDEKAAIWPNLGFQGRPPPRQGQLQGSRPACDCPATPGQAGPAATAPGREPRGAARRRRSCPAAQCPGRRPVSATPGRTRTWRWRRGSARCRGRRRSRGGCSPGCAPSTRPAFSARC